MKIIKLLKNRNEFLEALVLLSQEKPSSLDLKRKIIFFQSKKQILDRVTFLEKEIKKCLSDKSVKLNTNEKEVITYLSKQKTALITELLKHDQEFLNHLSKELSVKEKAA